MLPRCKVKRVKNSPVKAKVREGGAEVAFWVLEQAFPCGNSEWKTPHHSWCMFPEGAVVCGKEPWWSRQKVWGERSCLHSLCPLGRQRSWEWSTEVEHGKKVEEKVFWLLPWFLTTYIDFNWQYISFPQNKTVWPLKLTGKRSPCLCVDPWAFHFIFSSCPVGEGEWQSGRVSGGLCSKASAPGFGVVLLSHIGYGMSLILSTTDFPSAADVICTDPSGTHGDSFSVSHWGISQLRWPGLGFWAMRPTKATSL